ncbi:MAG: protein kinase [Muribaculaceae bacterium]
MNSQALAPGTELRSSRRTSTIQRVLGQGGFGITYLVETDFRMGNIDYTARFAVKEHFIQMLCERDSTTNRVRFLQSASKEVETSKKAFVSEAERLQRLGINHRNIVKVDEVFEANGTAYYVMEYLDGGSLADYVKTHGGRLSWAETARLMQPICDAVAMLHRNRVAHYDIKPQNIMVMTDKQGLRPVLIDFGLAKHYDGQGEATSSIAARGFTPGYAPNEQYQGITTFSPRADVYALAATVCYCLTGHAPAKAAELDLDKLCDELLSLGVDASVANILLRGLEFRAADRPADAGALAAALFAGGQLPTTRQPRTTPSEATELPSKREELEPAEASRETVPRKPVRPEPEPDKPVKQRWWTRRWLKITGISVACLAFIVCAFVFGDDIMWSIKTSCISCGENNLKLQVTDSYGSKFYYSQNEWNNLSDSQRDSYTKQGVVIDYAGERFVVKLNMARHGSGYEFDGPISFTWYEAKQWVNNMGNGWRLPTKDEGHAMADQYEDVCAAIKAFGGDDDPAWWYWTSTEYGASGAWYFSLYHGYVGYDNKSDNVGVRGVRAI